MQLLKTILAQPAFWRVGLVKTAVVLGDTLQLEDLQESDFPGYARQQPAWSAPGLNADGEAQSVSAVLTWQRAGAMNPQQVLGYFVVYSDGVNPAALVGVQNLPAALPMETAGQAARLFVKMNVADLG